LDVSLISYSWNSTQVQLNKSTVEISENRKALRVTIDTSPLSPFDEV